MTAQLPAELFPQLTEFITPFMGSEEERDAWLTQAFYLTEPRLYHQIDRSGNAMVFTVRCIKTLLNFECVLVQPTETTHSLSLLLKTLRYGCGASKQGQIDSWIPIINRLCSSPLDDPPADLLTPTSAPILPDQSLNTPLAKRTPTVFISYSHTDAEFAQRLIADLQKAGHAIWVDVSTLKGGDVWIRAISEGIINSYAFVLVATKRALQSPWVQDEIMWAKQRGKRILSVLVEDVVNEVEFFPLVNYQGIKFFGENYDLAVQKLLEGLPSPTISLPDEEEPHENVLAPVIPTQRALELHYLDRLRFEILLNTEKYTPLSGESRFRQQIEVGQIASVVMRPEYALLSREKDQPHEVRRFDNAVEEILALRRVVVLGEPGAGKTTTLWKLARDLVDKALTDPQAPIPLVIRLGKWTDDSQSLRNFIANELGELGHYLDNLLSEKRAVLLLDGLNEIPVAQRRRDRAHKDQQVGDFIEQHRDLLAVVSCRAQDYTLDLGFDRIEITPLDVERIHEFVVRYLGEEDGETLFWKLAGGTTIRQVWNKWRGAGADFKLFWEAPDIPRENPNVYGATSGADDEAWREHVRNPRGLMVLARNPYMLSMLAQVYVTNQGNLPDNRGELFRDFVLTLLVREKLVEVDEKTRRPEMNTEAEALLVGLGKLAYAMQVERAQAEDDNALTVLPVVRTRQFLNERQLYQAGSASILSVSDTVRFTHQLLQEYFAATAMQEVITSGKLQASDIWKARNWWERTNWEEAVILLAGLHSEDCTPVLNWISEANPEVAAQCIVRSGAQTSEITKQRLRTMWLSRLTDLSREPEPQGRAAVGRALSIAKLDNRSGVGVDENGLPDIEWALIPNDGSWTYQDKQHPGLPTFEMGRYPITYVQYQCFVEAADYDNPRWWEGMPEEEEVYGMVYRTREMSEQAFKYGSHPREMVSWYQAVAFCRWLSDKVGYEISLPTEQQWEKAARGRDGREYPYEGGFDATKGNTSETGIGQTNALGIFPQGASPYGVEEMSGNVWEWCLNKYEKSEETGVDASGDWRVLRGGSWYLSYLNARAVSRNIARPGSRNDDIGFRVCRPPSR